MSGANGRIAALVAVLFVAATAWAQHREYYVKGKVLDTARAPLAGVEVRLLEVATSREYRLRTDKDGVFKLAGLPHGVYEATFRRDGYAVKQDKWSFETPQDTMQRVEVPDVLLASTREVQEVQELKETESGIKDATEKIKSGQTDAALATLTAILERSPRDVNARFLLGTAYLKKKMYAEAAAALREVAEATPGFAAAHFALGLALRNLGQADAALEAYDKGLALEPGHADAAYNAGLILFETGRVPEALARFQAGLAARPGDAELLEMVGRCHIHAGDMKAALDSLEKARAAVSDPDKAAFLAGLIEKVRTQIR